MDQHLQRLYGLAGRPGGHPREAPLLQKHQRQQDGSGINGKASPPARSPWRGFPFSPRVAERQRALRHQVRT